MIAQGASLKDVHDLGQAAVLMMVVMMSFPMMMVMPVIVFVAVEVLHVMVMVLLLQHYIEIAGIDSGLVYTADAGREAIEGEASESFPKLLLVYSQVKERSDRHVAADPGIAFEIEGFLHGYRQVVLFASIADGKVDL